MSDFLGIYIMARIENGVNVLFVLFIWCEFTIDVVEDWNPWDNDAIITTAELQEIVNHWVNDIPKNGPRFHNPRFASHDRYVAKLIKSFNRSLS